MIAWWMAAGAFAQASWSVTFEAEATRRLPPVGARSVVAVGNAAVPAAAALCRAVNDQRARCGVKVVPRRARRDNDQWLASLAPEGVTYVVRRVVRSQAVSVSLFDSDNEVVDWYMAYPKRRAVPQAERDVLQSEVSELQERVEQLERAPAVTTELEAEALEHLEQAIAAAGGLDPEGAQEHLRWLSDEGAGTAANRGAERIRRELAVVGEAQATWAPATWVVADGPAAPTTALWVFWEPWCAHSRAALPRLQASAPAWEALGVPVLGISGAATRTKVNDVQPVAAEAGWTLPVAVGTADVADHYAVSAVPAAVLVHDGQVLWRGHAAHVTEALRSAFQDHLASDGDASPEAPIDVP